MTEYPGNKISILRYNTKGDLVYIKSNGSPAYQIQERIYQGNREKKIFLDDLVIHC